MVKNKSKKTEVGGCDGCRFYRKDMEIYDFTDESVCGRCKGGASDWIWENRGLNKDEIVKGCEHKEAVGSYWLKTGQFEVEGNCINLFVPKWGPAFYPEAEALRLISKVYYRFYNDGDTGNVNRTALIKVCADAGIKSVIVKKLTSKNLERMVDEITKQAYDLMKVTGKF